MGGNFDLSFPGEEIEAGRDAGLAHETTPTTQGPPHPGPLPGRLLQDSGPESHHPNRQALRHPIKC